MSFVSSKGNILCRLIIIQLYEIFAQINRAIKGLHCNYVMACKRFSHNWPLCEGNSCSWIPLLKASNAALRFYLFVSPLTKPRVTGVPSNQLRCRQRRSIVRWHHEHLGFQYLFHYVMQYSLIFDIRFIALYFIVVRHWLNFAISFTVSSLATRQLKPSELITTE